MAKIILNNEEFEFDGYNRNTYFGGESMSSNAYINGLKGTNLTSRLSTLGESTITSIQITVEDNTIYNLSNINAKLNSIDESFNGMNGMNVNLNIQFN